MSFPPNTKEYNRNDVGPQGALVRDSHTLCEPARADADSPSQLVGERLSENSHSRPSLSPSRAQLRSTQQSKGRSWPQILVGESLLRKVRERKMISGSHDPTALQEFRAALATRDPKTVATYLTTMRDFVTWLATQPGGDSWLHGLAPTRWPSSKHTKQGAFSVAPVLPVGGG